MLAALAAISISTASLRVQADSIPTRPMSVQWAQVPVLSFSAREFLTASVRKKLSSGLPQRVVTRVYAFSEKGDHPITVSATSCRVVYDLWEGVYRVEEQSDNNDRARNERTVEDAVRACLDVRSLALGNSDAFRPFRGRAIYFAAIIELNPLSADVIKRIRRWLSRSGGGQLRGDAFFGSFVSIFVSRQMGSAEHTLSFRSRTFDVPP